MNLLSDKEKEEFVFFFFLYSLKSEQLALLNSFLFFKDLKINHQLTIYSPTFVSKSKIFSHSFDVFLDKISFYEFFFDDFFLSQNGLQHFRYLKDKYAELYHLLCSFETNKNFNLGLLKTCALEQTELLNCSVCNSLSCEKSSFSKLLSNSTLFKQKNPYKSF